jgi:hypothetical protein
MDRTVPEMPQAVRTALKEYSGSAPGFTSTVATAGSKECSLLGREAGGVMLVAPQARVHRDACAQKMK